ncbi:MAG: hypothetical protein EOP04_08445 [Proteobacteria bacterium]|nr:MAG: hypothetical protein EOP04_08445 [Pseudomonadota bacterium]
MKKLLKYVPLLALGGYVVYKLLTPTVYRQMTRAEVQARCDEIKGLPTVPTWQEKGLGYLLCAVSFTSCEAMREGMPKLRKTCLADHKTDEMLKEWQVPEDQ